MPKANVLIVDDTPANLRLLVQMLTEQGYKVRPVPDGPRALAAARSTPPDLILLDVKMPDMDGYQVCKQLKADAETRDIPIIFLSALGETEDKVKAFTVGGVDYVTKPFQVEEVLARVETHLSLRNLQKQLKAQNVQLQQEIVQRKQATQALHRQTVELQADNAELDALAHTVVHDLKKPLGLVIGFSETLVEKHTAIPSEELAKYLDKIARNGHKVSNIIDTLLLLASVRRGKVQVEPLDMADIVTKALQRLTDLIEKYQAEIILPDTWPIVLGYGPWVEEVWANYISNALKYGGQPPRVEIGATPPSTSTTPSVKEEEEPARFWVRDNGNGLTPTEQAQLFTPFTRLGQVHVKGHGLGLSIVRRIVEKLNGQVGVESEINAGSTFWFSLRIVQK